MAIVLGAISSYGKGITAHPQLNARTADSLGKSLASLFLVKERNVPAAKHSMDVFQVPTRSQVSYRSHEGTPQQSMWVTMTSPACVLSCSRDAQPSCSSPVMLSCRLCLP